jgi:ABC-type taurine transport system substrate-binding protein
VEKRSLQEVLENAPSTTATNVERLIKINKTEEPCGKVISIPGTSKSEYMILSVIKRYNVPQNSTIAKLLTAEISNNVFKPTTSATKIQREVII